MDFGKNVSLWHLFRWLYRHLHAYEISHNNNMRARTLSSELLCSIHSVWISAKHTKINDTFVAATNCGFKTVKEFFRSRSHVQTICLINNINSCEFFQFCNRVCVCVFVWESVNKCAMYIWLPENECETYSVMFFLSVKSS